MNVAVVCMDSLLVCSGSSSKAPPLSFEKILLHFAKWCLSSSISASLHSELGLRVCCMLKSRLNDHRAKKKSAEIVNFLKLIHDLLWKCALQLEQKEKESVAELCLKMRTVALMSLVVSGKFEIGSLLKSAVKVDLRYRRAAATVGLSSTALCGHGHQDEVSAPESTELCSHNKNSMMLERVFEFHSSLEQNCDLLSLIHPSLCCREFTVGVGYLLQCALLCLKSPHHRTEGSERLSSALDLCVQHGENCSEDGHLIVLAQVHSLQLWNAIREEDGIK